MRAGAKTAITAAVTAAAILVSASLATAYATPSVTVTATCGARIDCRQAGPGRAVVRSNAPWTLVASTSRGTVVLNGDPSRDAGTLVTLPAGTVEYWVVAR